MQPPSAPSRREGGVDGGSAGTGSPLDCSLRLIERIDEEGTWLSRVFGLEVTRTPRRPRQSLGDEPVSDRLEAPPCTRFVVALQPKGASRLGL